MLLRPKIEKPIIPAPRAEYIDRSFLIISVSSNNNGRRCLPMKEEIISFSVLVWERTLSAFKKILDTACPDVPEDVSVFVISSFGTERNSNCLNKRTGRNGKSAQA